MVQKNKLNNELKELIAKNLVKHEQIKASLEVVHKSLVSESITYLTSQEAFASLESEPYWPKWFSPWWVMLTLYEMKLTPLIPDEIITKMTKKIASHYIPLFPLVESELPPNINPISNIICHCALGSMYKLLSEANVELEKEIPWFNEWFAKYQLPDGGFNCDESVYTKEKANSSIISTLPMLEALLLYKGTLTTQDLEVLQKGADYLLNKKLFKKQSDNSIMNENWLKPFFPRFYEYDILRGLNFLTLWALKTNKTLPLENIIEALKSLDGQVNEKGLLVTSNNPEITKINSFVINNAGEMVKKELSFFPLLNNLIFDKKGSTYLTREWYEVVYRLPIIFKDLT